jgi:hypothetical protein
VYVEMMEMTETSWQPQATKNVANSRDDNVAIGNFIIDISDPQHAEYQQACLRTHEQCVNNR